MSNDGPRQGYDDVLSSVRRIVQSDAIEEAKSDRLLLTPALRVAEPAPDVPDHSDEDETIAETPPAEEGSNSDEPIPDGVSQAVDADEFRFEGQEKPARDFPTLEDRIAELEAAVGSDTAEWEPDGSEDQAQHAPDAVVLPLNASARRAASAPSEDTAPGDIVFAVPGDASETPSDEDASAPDASSSEVEEAVEAIEDQAPAEEVTEEPVEAEMPAEDVVPVPEIGPVPIKATFRHHTAPPQAIAGRSQFEDDDPALLDEAALRDLVAEIVREELQGSLGERITRNVRKLVRAEIQRAFAARDLD